MEHQHGRFDTVTQRGTFDHTFEVCICGAKRLLGRDGSAPPDGVGWAPAPRLQDGEPRTEDFDPYGDDPDYIAWCQRQALRGELAGVAETAECYECAGFDGVHFVTRKIVALGPVVNSADPTQSYKLECGHTTI